jgi:hypothetical protein
MTTLVSPGVKPEAMAAKRSLCWDVFATPTDLIGPRRLGNEFDGMTIRPRRTKLRPDASPGFAAVRASRARDFEPETQRALRVE